MSTAGAFDELLRLGPPRCDVSRCRRNGPMRIVVRHPKRPTQSANVCATHLPAMLDRVKREGYTVVVQGADYEAGVGDLDSSG